MHDVLTAKLVKERSVGGNAARVNKHRKHEVMEPVRWSISMKGNGHRERQLVPTPFIALLHCVADDRVLENGRCVLGKWVAFVLTVNQEASLLTEINAGSDIRAVAFAANGEYLVGGGSAGVRVWRVEDGKEMATLEARSVLCLAVSKDGRWIAAGTGRGEVFVWDAKTYEKVFSPRDDTRGILGVDFSPDSSRLVSASDNRIGSGARAPSPRLPSPDKNKTTTKRKRHKMMIARMTR